MKKILVALLIIIFPLFAGCSIESKNSNLNEEINESYEVTLNLNGGELTNFDSPVFNVDHGDRFPSSGSFSDFFVLEKGEDAFEGWYLESDFSQEKITYLDSVTKDQTIYARWLEDAIRIEFNTYYQDPSPINDVYVEKGSRVPSSGFFSTPNREGYIFSGWTIDETPTPESPYVTITYLEDVQRNTTVYAKWRKIPNKMTLSLISSIDNELLYEFETDPDLDNRIPSQGSLPIPDVEGYGFHGWYDKKNGMGDEYFYVENCLFDKELYAYLIPTNKLKISFDSMGGSEVESIYADEGVRVPYMGKLPEPRKEGYRFEGWTKSIGSQTIYNYIEDIDTNLFLYANWVEDSNYNTLSFFTEGEVYVENIYFEDNQRVPEYGNLPYAYKKGHNFVGWYSQKDGMGEKISYLENISEGITLYAFFESKEYEVELDSDGGDLTGTYTYNYGEKILLDEDFYPTKQGYYFIGWYSEENGEGYRYEHIAKIDKNYNLYAFWKSSNEKNDQIEARYLRNIEAVNNLDEYEYSSLFDEKGYITNQASTEVFMFGDYDSSYNGCGWIATYNALRRLQLQGLYNNEISIPRIIKYYEYNGSMLSGKLGILHLSIKEYFESFENFEVEGYFDSAISLLGKDTFGEKIIASDSAVYGYLGLENWGHYMAVYNENDRYHLLNYGLNFSDFEDMKKEEGLFYYLITINVKESDNSADYYEEIKISFNKDGGINGDSQINTYYGQLPEKIEIPQKEGYIFDGYYTKNPIHYMPGENLYLTQFYDENGNPTRLISGAYNLLLHAKWIQID